MNDMPLFNSQAGNTAKNSSTKKKLKFETEMANFVSNFKAMIKEVGDLSNFMRV
jgi:hypothetical protein